MKLLINQGTKENIELTINQIEAEKISQALLEGVKYLKMGEITINTAYIIGIFDSPEPPISVSRRIKAPQSNPEKISKILNEMKSSLKKKGVL
jgi:hypothetical protein